MTTDQPSPSLPTVQTRKRGGKLKPKAPSAPQDGAIGDPSWRARQAQGQGAANARPRTGRELEVLRQQGRFGELKADFFTLALLTGMRKKALASVRREHVDTAARTIFIARPKGGEARAFTLPLSDAAWQIVQRRLAASNSPWLFPSPIDPDKHVADLRGDGAFSDWKGR